MSRSFIAGSVAGAALSVVTLASLSLLATPGGTNAPVDEVAATETPEAAAEPAAPATTEGEVTGATAGTETPAPAEEQGESTQTAASEPDAAIIDVPAGSEFAKPKADGETVVPGTEAAVEAGPAPAATPPAAEPAPELADKAPAAQPPSPTTAPAAAAEPATEAEPAPTAPAVAADTEIAMATEAAPAPPEAETDAAPSVGETATVQPEQATEPPAPAVAPAAPPAPEGSAQDQAPAPTAPPPQPAPAETAQPATTIPSQGTPDVEVAPPAPDAQQAPVVDPLAEGDDAPGPVPDAEADSGMPLNPPAGDAPADAGADGQAAAEKSKPPAPDAKFIKVTPSQKTAPEVQELALNTENAGVKVNRLPTVGASATAPEAAAPAPVLDGPLQKFAAPFDNPDAKPILAIVVIDKGVADGGLDPSALAALPFPVTIALDPMREDAAEAEKTYRDAGAEVAILASDLPKQATPADLEVAYQAYVEALPESVALLGGATSEIQRSSLAAQHVAALLAADGRGLITYDQGLNPGRHAAEKLGVPTAAIERVFGQAEDNSGTLGRELDRAAFTAGQRGRLVIALPSTPEAITGLMAWAASPGAAGVAIAPVSALIAPAPAITAEPPAATPEPAPADVAPAEPAPAPAANGSGSSGGTDSY